MTHCIQPVLCTNLFTEAWVFADHIHGNLYRTTSRNSANGWVNCEHPQLKANVRCACSQFGSTCNNNKQTRKLCPGHVISCLQFLPSHWVCPLRFSRFIWLLWSPWTWPIARLTSLSRRTQSLTSLRDRVDHLEDWVSEVKLPLVLYSEDAGFLRVHKHGSKVDVADRWDCVFAVHRACADFDRNTCDHFTAFPKMRLYNLIQSRAS